MRNFRVLRIALALAALVALAVPVGTQARFKENRPLVSAAFTVAGTNGYTLHVKSERGMAQVIVSRERPAVATISILGQVRRANEGSVSSATYTSWGQPRDGRTIDADLGPFGRITVAFQPSGEVHVGQVDLTDKSKKCVGNERIVRQIGTFAGTIRFAGENGYTAVETTSAPGSLGISPFRNCTTKAAGKRTDRPEAEPRPVLDGAVVMASSVPPGGSTSSFSGFANQDGAIYYALTGQVIDPALGLTVMRSAQAVGPSSAIEFNPAFTAASVEPPPPFAGSAAFRSQGSTRRDNLFSGTLSVEYPGLSVPLAGPDVYQSDLRPIYRYEP